MSRVRADVARLASGSAAQAAASAGVAVVSTLWLSPHERGVMVVAATVPALVSVVATLGVGNAYRARRPTATPTTAIAFAQTYSVLVAGTAAIGAAASIVLGLAAAAATLPELGSVEILAAMALVGAALCVMSTLTDAWFAAGRFGEGARWAAGSAVAGLATALTLHPTSAAGFLFAQFVAMGAVMGASLVPLSRAGLLGQPRIDRGLLSSFVRQGTPSLGVLAGTTVMMRADRIVLAGFVPPAAVAAYALASTVSEVVRLVPTALGQIALHRGAKDPDAGVRDLSRRSLVLVAAAALIVLPVAALTIPRVFGAAYSSSPGLLLVMVAGEFFFGSYLVAAMFLLGQGTARRIATLALIGAVGCVPMYIAGSAIGGAVGCACAGVGLYALLARLVDVARAPRRVMS